MPIDATIRGKAAIVGIGATRQGEFPDKTADQLAVESFREALVDCGLDKTEIDGLITCRSYGGHGVDIDVGRLAGVNPAYSATLDYGAGGFSLQLAVMAIASGLARCVAIMYGTNQRTAGNRFASAPIDAPLTEPYGFFNVGGSAALAFRRHQHVYGTTEEQLGHVAVGQRQYAQLNPRAIFKAPMSLEDYMAQPYLISPLRRADMTMISDGGACIIIASTDRAKEVTEEPIYVLGTAHQSSLREYQNPDNFMRPWIQDVARRLYPAAQVEQSDVDVLYIQDPFSVWVLQMLEWYGFCAPGEGGEFLAEGHTAMGGKLPVNTNGGQLSEAYMWGFLHLCEAVLQLRGKAGERQVQGAKIAQFSSTMTTKKAVATILGNEIP